jgi:class 3 adenylate cyclase
MGDAAFGRITYQPGWRWSIDVKPIVETETCQIHHVGYVISGNLRIEMADGTSLVAGPGDIFEVPPGHDAWVLGDEPWVSVDWTGRRHFGQSLVAAAHRVLATMMFTDIVGSTRLASELGDHQWRDRLADYHAMIRRALERHHGREIQTTGDGVLATFESPAHGVLCALDTTEAAPGLGLAQRAGLHTGEIEFAGEDVRGVAVHLAARVAAAADAGQVLVSATTNGLLFGSGIPTSSRGTHSLKGIEQPVELFEVTGRTAGSATT